MILQFNIKYLTYSVALLLTEVLIAVFVHDAILRPYGGDFLAVILLYCIIKTVLAGNSNVIALSVLLFSYILETLQYFGLVEIIGLAHSKVAKIIIGTSFEWIDILAYTLGILAVLIVEREIQK